MDDLARGRAAAGRAAWPEAFEALCRADRAAPLGPADLELLATAAYLVGRVPDCVAASRRAYDVQVAAGHNRPAARAAFWIVYALSNRGDLAQAGGWLTRAIELLATEPPDCAEQGLVLTARAFQLNHGGAPDRAAELAIRALDIGRRTGDPDVRGLAAIQCGGALAQLGRADEAMALLDEAMVAVVAAEVSPVVAGTVYCAVISICQDLAELSRAREWTAAVDAWRERQQGMVAFTGLCLVHRAELLQLGGRWPEAAAEAQRAGERLAGGQDAFLTGAVRYRQAEIHRLSGDLAAAERAYREAGEAGYDPCPGLALLRLAQGDAEAARAVLRRALAEADAPLRRVRLLPAQVEVALSVGDVATARTAAEELAGTAEGFGAPALRALADCARGAVLLAGGEPAEALSPLRAAAHRWRDLDMPYEAARARELIGLACRELGDRDTAAVELAAAGRAFAELGAGPDRARVDGHRTDRPAGHGLTAREVEVLRLVATGKTNRAIATALSLSDKTVERHLSNVFGKLGVSSRAAATAYAYRQGLL